MRHQRDDVRLPTLQLLVVLVSKLPFRLTQLNVLSAMDIDKSSFSKAQLIHADVPLKVIIN